MLASVHVHLLKTYPQPCFAAMLPFNLQAMKLQLEVATVATPQQRWAVTDEAQENNGMAGPDDDTIPAVLTAHDDAIPVNPPENEVSCHISVVDQ